MTQTLAAAQELMEHWLRAPSPYGKSVITAAIDARRPGVRDPVPDAFLEAAATGYLTPGEQMAGRGVWDHTANQTGWAALLGEARGRPDVSPYAAPARAADLSDLPPAFIDVGSAETFRDEDVSYASRIWQAGGIAELHVWPGGFHGFAMIAPDAALSREAAAAQLSWLRRLLAD